MRYLVYFLFLPLSILECDAQSMAISNDGSSPHASSILEIKSTSKGILIPRMTQSQRDLISSPATGLMIFQTNNTPGYYYYSGSAWIGLMASSNGWALTGNIGTNPSNNFLGTADNQPLRFRLNNKWAGHLGANSYFIGDSAGISTTAVNAFCTGLGYHALKKNTTGINNVAIGANAMEKNTTGAYNTALGNSCLKELTTAFENTAVGYGALKINTTGESNAAFGSGSLDNNFSGDQNAAFGSYTLSDNHVGSNNTAVGNNALGHSDGSRNSGIGRFSLDGNTVGNDNSGIGYACLSWNETGSYNIAIGSEAGTSGSYDNTVSIGNHGYLNAGNNQVFLGNLSSSWNGGNVSWSTFSDARVKVNVREDVIGLEFIRKLRPVTYHRDIDVQTEFTGNKPSEEYPNKYDIEQIKFSGFLAQEVEQAANESGYDFSGITKPRNEHELYTLSYESFVVPLVKAVQEQQILIEELRHEIISLKKQQD